MRKRNILYHELVARYRELEYKVYTKNCDGMTDIEIEDAMDEMETIQYELMPFVNKDEENYE